MGDFEIEKELAKKGLADNGLVVWWQNTSSSGIVDSLTSPMCAISSVKNKIIITTFTNKIIDYDSAISYESSNIIKAKVLGILYFSKLVIKTINGATHKYSIMQGKGSVKQMSENLGL